jgi:hypothetical protein
MPEEDGSRSSLKFPTHFSTFLRCCGEEAASAANDSSRLPVPAVAAPLRSTPRDRLSNTGQYQLHDIDGIFMTFGPKRYFYDLQWSIRSSGATLRPQVTKM